MAGKYENGSGIAAAQPRVGDTIGSDRFGHEAGRTQALGNQRLTSVVGRRDRPARDQLLGEFESGGHRSEAAADCNGSASPGD